MSTEVLTIKDPNFRVHNKNIEKAMKQHEAENLARAAAKEKELLERKGLIDVFVDGMEKISKLFSQKQKKEIEILQKQQHSKEK